MGSCLTVDKPTNSKTVLTKYETTSKNDWVNNTYNLKQVRDFVPPIKHGKVVKVYDGDTFTIVTKIYDEPVCKIRVRLAGIDTPELKGCNGNEKTMALVARDKLSELILGKIVRLDNVTYEKYGRLLCQVYVDNINVNNWMISNNLAIAYNDRTKSNTSV